MDPMTDLDTLLTDHPASPESARSVVTRSSVQAPKDETAVRRGRAADRLGKDNERRVERVYGPRKVGEYGDAVDLIGRDFVWQSKASRADPRLWLAAITDIGWEPTLPVDWRGAMIRMLPLAGHRYPLLIRSYVKQGVRTRDWIVVHADHWRQIHGGEQTGGWVVMTGAHFIQMNGRDEP